jgi:hypothetical protein
VDHPAEKHLTMKLTRAKFEAWSAQEMALVPYSLLIVREIAVMKRQILINARLRLERAYLKLRLFLQV